TCFEGHFPAADLDVQAHFTCSHPFSFVMFTRGASGRNRPGGRRLLNRARGAARGVPRLLSNSEFPDDVAVALRVGHLEVVEQSPAPADDLQKPLPGMVVLGVG